MRIGIVGFNHESNTFLPTLTHWDDFAAVTIASGGEVVDTFAGTPHEIGGFLDELAIQRVDVVPLFAARAMPSGPIEHETFQRITRAITGAIRACGPLDGLLVAPHGAAVSPRATDADGAWLSELRELVGNKIPIVGTLDPHANLSPAMVAACNALVAYRTNPHVDQHDRGREAARLLLDIVNGRCRPTMTARFLPMAMGIEAQCTDESPCKEVFQVAAKGREEPGVLGNSILFGFPYADVGEMGTSVLVVTNDDHQLAEKEADRLAGDIWNRRDMFVHKLPDAPTGVRQALQMEPPVCLLDVGDNVGGGAPADGTWLASELVRQGIQRSLVVLHDAMAVQSAAQARLGDEISICIGGRSGPWNGPPLEGRFIVKSLHDGKFTETQPTHGGFREFDQGQTAVLENRQRVTVVVTSRRMVPFSLGQLTSCGLDPSRFRVLVAKGVNAPIAAYRRVCKSFLRVDTPGYTRAAIEELPYVNRRRPLFPFEVETPFHHSDQ